MPYPPLKDQIQHSYIFLEHLAILLLWRPIVFNANIDVIDRLIGQVVETQLAKTRDTNSSSSPVTDPVNPDIPISRSMIDSCILFPVVVGVTCWWL